MNNNKKGGNTTIRSSREIKESLLRRAFAAGRGEEMKQKIKDIKGRVNDMPEGHSLGLALAQIFDGECGESQSLRKLSLRTGIVYKDMTFAHIKL